MDSTPSIGLVHSEPTGLPAVAGAAMVEVETATKSVREQTTTLNDDSQPHVASEGTAAIDLLVNAAPHMRLATTPRLLDKFDNLTSDWNFASSETPKLVNKLGDLQRQWSMDSESNGKEKFSIKRQHPSSPGAASSLSIGSTMGRSTFSSYETCLAHVSKADAQQATFERLYQNAKPYVAPPKCYDEMSAVSVCSPLTGRASLEKRLSYIAPGEVRRVRQQQRLEASSNATPRLKTNNSVFERLHRNQPRTESLMTATPKNNKSTLRTVQRHSSNTKVVQELSPHRLTSTHSAHRTVAAKPVIRNTDVGSDQRRPVYLSPASNRKIMTHRITSSASSSSSMTADSAFERLYRRDPRPSLVKQTKTSGGSVQTLNHDSKSTPITPPRRKIVRPVASGSYIVSPTRSLLASSQASRITKGSVVGTHTHRRQGSLPLLNDSARSRSTKPSNSQHSQDMGKHRLTDTLAMECENGPSNSAEADTSNDTLDLAMCHVKDPVRMKNDKWRDSALAIQRFWRMVYTMRRFRKLLSAIVNLQSKWRGNIDDCQFGLEQRATVGTAKTGGTRSTQEETLASDYLSVDSDTSLRFAISIQTWWRTTANNRRREKAILLMQRLFRRYMCWSYFHQSTAAAAKIQCAYRNRVSQRTRNHQLDCASLTIQRQWTKSQRRETSARRQQFATKLQWHWRRYRISQITAIQIHRKKLNSRAVVIQVNWRSFRVRMDRRRRKAAATVQRVMRRFLMLRLATSALFVPSVPKALPDFNPCPVKATRNDLLPSSTAIFNQAAVTIQKKYSMWKRKRLARTLRILESATCLFHRSLYGSLSRSVLYYAILQVNVTLRSSLVASSTKIIESCSSWQEKWNQCKLETSILAVILLQSFARGCLCRMSLAGRDVSSKPMFQMKAASKRNVLCQTTTATLPSSPLTLRLNERKRRLLKSITYKSAALASRNI